MADETDALLSHVAEDEARFAVQPRDDDMLGSADLDGAYIAWLHERLQAECRVKRQLLAIWPDPLGTWNASQADAARAVKDQMRRLLASLYDDEPAPKEDPHGATGG